MPYHLIGVGGIGMSALARILLDRKEEVTGSDAKPSPLLAALEKEGVKLSDKGSGTIVVSSAIPPHHPEVKEAKKGGYPILHRSELLQELARPFKTLAVTGTHGKTTTTSLLAWVLLEAGFDPAFALGGILKGLGRNGRLGKGNFFVLEADESDGSFLHTTPYGAILTGIEADHLDYWGDLKTLQKAFDRFAGSVESDQLFFCHESFPCPGSISYGFGLDCQLRASEVKQGGFSLSFTAHFAGQSYPLTVPLIGRHNALNALAVFGMALQLGAEASQIRAAFATFPGVLRRCQIREVSHGAILIDDYAHHPTAIKTTLQGVRAAIKERRLIALFEPHRYSRLQQYWDEFLEAFETADEVWVSEVYPAGEEPIEGISGKAFANALGAKPVPEQIELGPADVLVGLGAGNVSDWIQKAQPTVKKRTIGVVCGGPSPEHLVSIVSAKAIAAALPRERYEVKTFGMTRASKWLTGEEAFEQLREGLPFSQVLPELESCDLLIPVFHGPQGEDGEFAALCEYLGIPYVGCPPLAAALCMDKCKTKPLAQSAGIPTAPFVTLRKGENLPNLALTYPLFVKTASSGSSLGVYKVNSEGALAAALANAFALDDQLVIEQGIEGRELEFAVLGNEALEIPPPGEVLTNGKMYTYEGKTSKPVSVDPTPHLPPNVCAEGKALAARVYRLLGCQGLTRVDFFLDRENRWWFNEANPFPGFTPISLYPKIWAANGLPFPNLLERLINLGFARARRAPWIGH